METSALTKYSVVKTTEEFVYFLKENYVCEKILFEVKTIFLDYNSSYEHRTHSGKHF